MACFTYSDHYLVLNPQLLSEVESVLSLPQNHNSREQTYSFVARIIKLIIYTTLVWNKVISVQYPVKIKLISSKKWFIIDIYEANLSLTPDPKYELIS